MRSFLLFLSYCSIVSVQAFVSPSATIVSTTSSLFAQEQQERRYSSSSSSSRLLSAAVEIEEDIQTDITSKGLLKRDRYVATNRFAVRKGKAGKFEKRWVTRKSRLATLEGFKYFHLMRRVNLEEDGSSTYDEGSGGDDAFGNYVSFTIWEKKSHFSAWRKGDAFVEAHGGTSIGAFLNTMVNSALVLQGAPKPAFYDGLMLQSVPPKDLPDIVDGWRAMEADGVTTLPAECFVACNQFFVPQENAAAFERRWAERESRLSDCDGFVGFSLLRRDGQAKGHGIVPMSDSEPTYQSTTIWRDRKAFEAWRQGPAFGEAHGQGKSKSAQGGDEAMSPPAPLWSKPPKPVFYEGTLVITKAEGA